MTLRSILLIIAIALFCMNFTVHCNVNDPPDCYEDLQVPYHQQECENYCGVACVQMWADYDGWSVEQSAIANYVGILPGGYNANPYELESAVGFYTHSLGYLARKDWSVPGAQGDLISSIVVGIDNGVPAIMPFNMDHAVLIKGSKWNEKPDGSPLAKRVYYHDPWGAPNQNISAAELKELFMPSPFHFWVILGWEDFLWNGIMGHDTFVLMGGTYYGGPSYYNPKNLDLNQEPN